MTWFGWFLLIGYILLSISLYKVFEKAGEPGWKALVPGLNFVVWCRLIGRPAWWAAWLLVPIVNIFIYAGMAVDLARSFGGYSFLDSFLAVVFGPFYFGYVGLQKSKVYGGPVLDQEKAYAAKIEEAREKGSTRQLAKLEKENPYKKSAGREWVEAVIFAVFAAAFIRMFLIEAYVIPTSSMEGSLLVGDFLFVSKANYGIRLPETVIQVPLLHNRLPFGESESYLKEPSLPYRRLPALERIDHNDPVVFNLPAGDSVYVFPDRTWTIQDYRYGMVQEANPAYHQMIKSGRKELVVRPVDKKDHYIKRAIGLPGDSLQIIDRQVYLNGEPAEKPSYLQYMYMVTFPQSGVNTQNFSDWGISDEDFQRTGIPNTWIMFLSDEQKTKVQNMDQGIEISEVDFAQLERNPNKLYPHDAEHFSGWTVDNYGPIWIPKAGETITLTPENLALYRRPIAVYEDNTLEVKDGNIYINGQQTNQYTFKMDYYWMMGDNRHNSEDSRVWGFVPGDHIVGKPLFIWFSLKEGSLAKGINWKRIFSSADKQ